MAEHSNPADAAAPDDADPFHPHQLLLGLPDLA
eukprot:CAMPEP_0202880482 /NCGR_PEP_ID=MMETSP1391-20130828/35154_1 /ASSEMBLY_ACC=CAM_ASM_000867 /TAXON_ID=1034604 /ORGANISM="Chlamydomonas leiostraca, Strain SAG 11-49" /LENGTH=32 /DNA_ID= /DNA_START= /DNA_END= /DNA_ORIENTATION=